MASKKSSSSTDEFGNKISMPKPKTGSKTMRTARSSGAESKRSKKMDTQPSSARAAGAKAKASAIKSPPRSARAAGAEKVKPSSYPQSARAAGAKAKANDTQPSSFRAKRFGKGKVGASAPASRNKTQSMRAAEYKKKNPGKY
jgi:hypothetical protein